MVHIKQIPKDILKAMYRTMVMIRQFEDTVYYMFLEGKLPGTVHLYQGQEAVAAGVCANLRKEDVIFSTHRADGHAVAKGVSLDSCMAELFGKATGCCKGKGGAMHLGDMDAGMPPAIAIVGGGLPLAAGCGLAFKYKKQDNVSVAFFGDGAANEGAFHESLNMAAIWNLPVIFVCENNLYGASTHISKVMKAENVADRASAYGIPGVIADGNDMIDVYVKTGEAVKRAREGKGPTLLECKTYRRGGHSRGDSNLYRDKKEEEIWLARDPLVIARGKMVREGMLTEMEVKDIDEQVKTGIEKAIKFAEESPFPAEEEMFNDLWAD